MAATITTERLAEARSDLRGTVFALMGRHRVTQTRLAAIIGISQGQLSQRLTGHLPFNEDQLLVIATAFGITVPDLFHAGEAVEKSTAPPVEWGQRGKTTGLLPDGGDAYPQFAATVTPGHASLGAVARPDLIAKARPRIIGETIIGEAAA